jgi:hypothetical protein
MRYWRAVLAATFLVAICPILIVWMLRALELLSSAVLGMILGVGLSLGASWLGRVVWNRRRDSEDLLFSELLVWGFVHRLLNERRLSSAHKLIGRMNRAQRAVDGGLSRDDQAKQLERLASAMDRRDRGTAGHSRRVARHAWMIARRMGLAPEAVARIRTAAAIHDIGKIETPLSILHKAGPLTGEEYEIVKRHPGDGARMAALLHDPQLTEMVRSHHERLDGSGYPDGRVGEEIPLGARIIAVADTFDAIGCERPYRAARTHRQAMAILHSESGVKLDAAAVKAFSGHSSGRISLALWASLTTLPGRVLSWLGSGAATVASVAKAAGVAVLVGGLSIGAASTAHPVAAGHRTGAQASRSPHLGTPAVSAKRPTSDGGAPASHPRHQSQRSRGLHGSTVSPKRASRPRARSGAASGENEEASSSESSGKESGEAPVNSSRPEHPGGAGHKGPPEGAGKPEGAGRPEGPSKPEAPAKSPPEGAGKPEGPAKSAPEGAGKPEGSAEGGGKPEAPAKGAGKP